jgi:hypothetical protein
MNADELRPILTGYRAEVEKGWTTATAMPGYSGGPGLPNGQCGATSAWLRKRLLDDHNLKTHFTAGVLMVGSEVTAHCWLETHGYELVLDITADQMDRTTKVVCCSPTEAAGMNLVYVSHMYLPDLDREGDLLRRTALLTEAVGR